MEHDFIIITDENVTGEAQQVSLAKALRTSAGRTALAASMVQPLRTTLDYQGIARKVFQVMQLSPGTLSSFDKDPE